MSLPPEGSSRKYLSGDSGKIPFVPTYFDESDVAKVAERFIDHGYEEEDYSSDTSFNLAYYKALLEKGGMIALKGLCCLLVPIFLIPKVACGAVVVLGVSSVIAGARGLYGLFRLFGTSTTSLWLPLNGYQPRWLQICS